MLVAGLAAAGLTLATTAQASTPPDTALQWDDDLPRFRPLEYAATLVVGLGAMAEYTWVPPRQQPHWVGGILFDDAVRNELRVRSPSAQRAVWAASDAVGTGGVVLVVGLDSMVVPLLRGSFDVAWQLTWMDMEAFAFGSVVTFSLYDSVGRARPSYTDCQRGVTTQGCDVSPTASFPSGHTAEAFLSAGLSCANHAYVPIYGSHVADALACARDLTLATADGVLRIMGDRHYTTDALAGGAIGFGFGYALPVLFHYARRGYGTPGFAVVPMGGNRMGFTAVGVF
jgi:membrane-associated phospholipid phosphatase